MKKFLTLCTALLLMGSMSIVQADYYVAHNGLLGGQEWSNNKEIMTSNGNGEYYRTYFAVPSSSTKIAFKVTNGTWTNPLGAGAKDNTKSDVTLSGSDNIEFTNSALQNITIWTNGTKVWVKVNDPIIKQHVLNGTKVMFYYGSPTSWGNNTMYFSTSNKKPNADGAVYESGKPQQWKSGYYSAVGLFALNSSTTYYLSNNNDWAGNGKSGLTAGCFADMSGSVTGNTSFVCTLGSTSYAITEGDASVAITSTVSGKSGLGLSYSLDHYYISADGSTWSEFDPTNTSSLAVGTYTIKALATDGHIYMVSTNSATLTVSAYVPGAYNISATAATKWTYGSLPASQTEGELVEFTVTPNDGYSVEVSSSDATITKNGNTYSFTMPDNDVAISVVATALSYNITYPASPSHYTLAGGNPTSGNTDAAINFTATPDENYFLTVTVNGNVVVGVNNVYSFTMPAEAVTVAITATSYRVFNGSTPIYLKADAVSWWLDANAVQKATFTKADNTTVTVTGALEEGVIYAFTPAAGAYKSVQFSRHNPSNVSEDWGHTDPISLIGTEAQDYVTVFVQNSGTATWSTFVPSPSYTFTAGTTIYYDFTAYTTTGINTYVGGTEVWHASTGTVISQTLEADWKVTASTKLWRCGAGGEWNDYFCTTLPTEGQDMIVSTDGINFTWGTYVPPVEPTVDFVSLGNTLSVGQTAIFAATSTNVEHPVYTFYVKKGSGEYGSAVTSFNFNEAGTYTVKVEVDGDDSKHAEATKDVTVVEGAHTIYFVKDNAWAEVYAHMWGVDPGTTWPGDIMTLTTSVTEKNQYAVYAVTFTPNYPSIKFNNGLGLETGNLTIDNAKPYYYNGQWYATLAECDPITVSLSGLDNGYLVGANATISATSNLTSPSYTYQVKVGEGDFAALEDNPYTFAATGNYTFKVTATGVEGSKTATQTVMVYEPLTINFVNKEGWENVNAYFYTPEKTGWPGDPMSLTEATTAKHSYKVYSATIGAGAHANVIFNNGSAQTSDLTINAAKPYYYDGEWYATLAEIDPETYVDFDGVDATVLVNTPLTLAATSNVTNPTYNYYVKPAVGDYAAITSPHTFTAAGIYTLKVEALENGEGEPVASRTKDIEVYATHTFTAGTRIYVDFTAMTEGAKNVNYPFGHVATSDPLDYDENGAGTFKTIRFSENVEWSTLSDFIKTEKAGWAGLKFTVPADGQNKIIVAADGASYTWGTYTPATVQVKFFAPRDESSDWSHVYAHSWDAAGDITSWPGVEITDSKANLWYAYNVQVGANVLFHNGNGMQTANIENVQAAACYESTAIDYEDTPKKVTVTVNTGCEIAYHIAGSKTLIGGEADFDTNLALDENNQIVFQDVKPGTYSFKINNGTWAWAIGGNDHLKGGDCASIAATVGVGDVGFQIDTKQDITITYYPATQEICLGAATIEPIPDIEAIGGKFIINAKGDTAVFSRGNLQYKQTSDKWRCAPKQYEWKGADNLQMGNTEYPGWVDLFSWSIGAENNYGATSAYNTSLYYNKDFVDWGGLFEGGWSTLSIDQWFYMLYNRANADDLWGMAMIGDTLGMVLLPNGWTAPSGVTFVPGTTPTTDMWYSADCLDPEVKDHWRVNPDNMPANKFTEEQWAILEAAGAVFCPYGGRRSGGYGNHTNRDNVEIVDEYAYTYYENYQGAYWTSTVRNAAEGKVYWLPMMCNGCINENENWGRGAHGWWENGRYGHSVRLVHIIPRQYTVTYTAGEGEGTVPTDENKYLDGAEITLAAATGLSKEGYRFAGWKFKGATYDAGASYTVNNVLANEEIVFEAQWEEDWTEVRTSLAPNAYYTMCLTKAVTEVRGGTIWKVLSKAANGLDVILEEVIGTLDAGRPYIFYATAANLEVIYTGEAVDDPVNEEANNGLIGSFTQQPIAQNPNYYIIYNNELYYVNSDNVYVGANRAYLDMTGVPDYPNAAPAPGRRRVSMAVHGKNAPTGIETIDNSQFTIHNCQKVLINGQLFILRGEKMYDAKGQLVK